MSTRPVVLMLACVMALPIFAGIMDKGGGTLFIAPTTNGVALLWFWGGIVGGFVLGCWYEREKAKR